MTFLRCQFALDIKFWDDDAFNFLLDFLQLAILLIFVLKLRWNLIIRAMVRTDFHFTRELFVRGERNIVVKEFGLFVIRTPLRFLLDTLLITKPFKFSIKHLLPTFE